MNNYGERRKSIDTTIYTTQQTKEQKETELVKDWAYRHEGLSSKSTHTYLNKSRF